ncbi:MAG: 2-oxo acid dehydrogenase subunit E2 [Alphaproteobacteria bacterium]|nr:2-oxo acid dehydrogenase subunit E2 [Alphaproteobacteria bacterium]
MAEFYEMPSVSPTMEFGTLVQWKIAEGQAFESGAVMAEVGTDKANMDAEIFDSGVLLKHLVQEGAEIPPGYPIAIWGQSREEDISGLLAEFEKRKSAPKAAAAAEPAAPAAELEPDEPTEVQSAKPATPSAPASLGTIERQWMGKKLTRNFMDPPGDIQAASVTARPKASPLARKIAADRGIDLHRLTGSGPGGRIVQADVEKAPAGGAPAASARADASVRNSPMRKTIAKRLLQSHQDIPVFFLTATFDMQGFVDLRDQLKKQLPDVKVSYNDILIKAVAKSLTEHPWVNAQWSADAILQKGSVDIGVAVALPAGLITPVVRNADQKSLAQIGTEVRDLAGRAKDGKLAVEEYTNGTFTISNLGMMDIEHFTAIINPPESAILAVGSIDQVPVVTNGQLGMGWRMKVTMSCDHRVIDGAVGAAFLQTLRKYVESPVLLLV